MALNFVRERLRVTHCTYMMDMQADNVLAAMAGTTRGDSDGCTWEDWHKAMGHISPQTLKLMWDSSMVEGMHSGQADCTAFTERVDYGVFQNQGTLVTLGSPGYGQGLLGLADIRSATRLPPQPPGPPGVPLMVWGQ